MKWKLGAIIRTLQREKYLSYQQGWCKRKFSTLNFPDYGFDSYVDPVWKRVAHPCLWCPLNLTWDLEGIGMVKTATLQVAKCVGKGLGYQLLLWRLYPKGCRNCFSWHSFLSRTSSPRTPLCCCLQGISTRHFFFFNQGHPFTEDVHSGSVGMGDISGTSKLGQQLSHVVLCLLGEGGAWCLPPPGGTVSVQSESCQHLEAWVDFWSICLSFPASVPSSYTESRGGTSWHLYNLWTFLRKTGEKSEHKLGRKTNLYLGFKFLESEKSRAVLWNLFNFPEMLMKTCFQATWLFLST